MKSTFAFAIAFVLLLSAAATGNAQQEKRRIEVKLTVPSTAYKLQIKEIYQTKKEIWVLSTVKGGGIGLTVISKVKDSVNVKAPMLPIKHFIVGKTWNWTEEKNYTYLKNRKKFEQMVKKNNAKQIYQRKEKKGAQGKNKRPRYIVMYRKEIFANGKTQNGETLQQLAAKHAKQFGGKIGRFLGIINGYTIELTPANAQKLGRLPEVRAIELDRPVGIGLPR